MRAPRLFGSRKPPSGQEPSAVRFVPVLETSETWGTWMLDPTVAVELVEAHADAVVRDRLERAGLRQRLGDPGLAARVEHLAFRLPRLLLQPAVDRLAAEPDPQERARLAGTLQALFVPHVAADGVRQGEGCGLRTPGVP